MDVQHLTEEYAVAKNSWHFSAFAAGCLFANLLGYFEESFATGLVMSFFLFLWVAMFGLVSATTINAVGKFADKKHYSGTVRWWLVCFCSIAIALTVAWCLSGDPNGVSESSIYDNYLE